MIQKQKFKDFAPKSLGKNQRIYLMNKLRQLKGIPHYYELIYHMHRMKLIHKVHKIACPVLIMYGKDDIV